MMLEIPLMLSKMYLLAQMTVCPVPEYIPEVDVQFKTSKVEYVTAVPVKALTKSMSGNKDATHLTDNPNWHVFGMTVGLLGGGNYRVLYTSKTDQTGQSCIYIDRVEFLITYTPTIFIGKELQTSECRFKMVKLHEQRHVATDLKVIKEYLPKIKMEILWYLRGVGAQGPFPQYEIDKNGKRVVDEVVKYVRPMVEQMIETKRARQSDIDTVENYKYESGLCPGDYPQLEQ